MKITANTKISEIINNDIRAVHVIASINKHFGKLKNPVLRKVLASRVNVADAAKIAGITTEEFLIKLRENGFEVEIKEGVNPIKKEKNNNLQTNKMNGKQNIVTLDVRPILEGGNDPFDEIIKTLKTLNDDQTLLIINTFEPIPLLNILKKKGYKYDTQRPEEGVVHCYIQKSKDKKQVEAHTNLNPEHLDFEQVEATFQNNLQELDVRDLEMPMPMVTILETLEKLDEGKALFVHHKRLPQFLLPELENRGFKLVSKEIDDKNMDLIIFK